MLACRTLAWLSGGTAAAMWFSDPDLWGHLRYGLDAIRDGKLTRVDPYSFTSDKPWINHEWLSEVLLGGSFLAGGVPGMLILKTLVVSLAFGLLSWRSRNAAAPARWIVLALTFLVVASLTVTWRPQVWTVLALAVLTSTVDLPTRHKLIVWPLLFCVWANLHGGWIVGLGVVCAWTLGSAVDRRDARTMVQTLIVCLFCLAATLLTPYGVELWRFIWTTVGFGRHDIGEWQSIAAGEAVWVWLATMALVAVLMWRTPWSWAAALPVFMLAAASARVNRLTPLCVVTAVGLLLPHWRGTSPARMPGAVTAMLAAMTLLTVGVVLSQPIRCLMPAGTRPPDVAAAGAFLGRSGRLVLPMDWGQFALWHLSPEMKVSFDGRRETVYSAERIREQHGMARRDESMLPFIEAHRPEYVWAARPEGELLAAALTKAGYRIDGQTHASIVLSRADLPALTLRPMSPCFP